MRVNPTKDFRYEMFRPWQLPPESSQFALGKYYKLHPNTHEIDTSGLRFNSHDASTTPDANVGIFISEFQSLS